MTNNGLIYTSQIKKDNIDWVLKMITMATAQDKCVSLKKLKAVMAMQKGISENKFDEYLQILINAEQIKVEGDDAVAWDKEKGGLIKDGDQSGIIGKAEAA